MTNSPRKLLADQRNRGFLADGTNARTGTDRDARGYDWDGYDARGFRPGGKHLNGTRFGLDGLDVQGYDVYGYDADGVDKRGNRRDLNMRGQDLPLLERATAMGGTFVKSNVVPGFYKTASEREWRAAWAAAFDRLALHDRIEKVGRRWQVSVEGRRALELSLTAETLAALDQRGADARARRAEYEARVAGQAVAA